MDLSLLSSEIENINGIYFAKKNSAISYPEHGNELCFQIEENSFWFRHRNQCILEAVKKYARDQLFFDIGGGNGYVAKGLENNGIETVLVEPGVQGAANAKKRNLKNIICSTLEDAHFKKNSMGAVGLFDVVEHIEDDTAFLTTVFNFLKVGGLVFITVPAYKVLWSNDDDYAGHFRRYTTNKLERKLNQIGFEMVYSSYLFSILPLPVFLFRSLPSKLGLIKKNKDMSIYVSEHKTREGIVDKLLNKIWKFELNKIRKGKKVPFGGSCFVVARKK